LFVLGKEGFFGKLSPWGSVVGHCIVDLLSKNVSATSLMWIVDSTAAAMRKLKRWQFRT
jgi:hypothetical protein